MQLIYELVKVHVTSFGYLHGTPPGDVHLVIDLRKFPCLRNPADDPSMRQATGLEPQVRHHVLQTPGVPAIVQAVTHLVETLTRVNDPTRTVTRVAVGCAGGRHRSVVVADEIAMDLAAVGVGATVTHRDVHLAVVNRS